MTLSCRTASPAARRPSRVRRDSGGDATQATTRPTAGARTVITPRSARDNLSEGGGAESPPAGRRQQRGVGIPRYFRDDNVTACPLPEGSEQPVETHPK